MLAIRRILHPTDFSHRSEHAFRVACALARDYNAPLLVLHVVAPAMSYGEGFVVTPPPDYMEELRRRLERVDPHDPKVVLERKLVEGDAATEVLRTAGEAGCDLIVMGTHGWTGLTRLLMGSVAEQVVRKAACPVLTVKAPFPTAVAGEPPAVMIGAR